MKLYGYYRSSASYRIRIVLNVKGIAWESHPVMLADGDQHSEEFRSINPAGFVPVLDTGSALLAQSPAIAEYLEEAYPAPSLLSEDALTRARIREMQGIVACDIHPLQNLRILKFLRSEYGQDDAGIAAWSRRWISAGFTTYETLASRRSGDGRYSVGTEFTLADAWLLPQYYNANRFGVDCEAFPTINSIVEHCLGIPAVAAAHPSRQAEAPSA